MTPPPGFQSQPSPPQNSYLLSLTPTQTIPESHLTIQSLELPYPGPFLPPTNYRTTSPPPLYPLSINPSINPWTTSLPIRVHKILPPSPTTLHSFPSTTIINNNHPSNEYLQHISPTTTIHTSSLIEHRQIHNRQIQQQTNTATDKYNNRQIQHIIYYIILHHFHYPPFPFQREYTHNINLPTTEH
jgi:hypothetical protein